MRVVIAGKAANDHLAMFGERHLDTRDEKLDANLENLRVANEHGLAIARKAHRGFISITGSTNLIKGFDHMKVLKTPEFGREILARRQQEVSIGRQR